MNALRVIAPETAVSHYLQAINGPEETSEINGYRLTAFRVNLMQPVMVIRWNLTGQVNFSWRRALALNIPKAVLESSPEGPDS